jgi:hypothetical protein
MIKCPDRRLGDHSLLSETRSVLCNATGTEHMTSARSREPTGRGQTGGIGVGITGRIYLATAPSSSLAPAPVQPDRRGSLGVANVSVALEEGWAVWRVRLV